MAARSAIAIRQQQAMQRLEHVAQALAVRFGVTASPLAAVHRDPDIAHAMQIENVAMFLESLEAAVAAASFVNRKAK